MEGGKFQTTCSVLIKKKKKKYDCLIKVFCIMIGWTIYNYANSTKS